MLTLCRSALLPAGPVARQRLLVTHGGALPMRGQLARAFPTSAPSYSDIPAAEAAPQRPAPVFPPAATTSGPTSSPSHSTSSPRVYTAYYVYKTRAALCVSLVPPTFSEQGNAKALERDGVMLLEFANANPAPAGVAPQQPGNVNRTYNWGSKILFALNATELGNILEGATLAEKGLTLYHDPTKLGKEGQPMKKLSLRQLNDGAINFNMVAGTDNISVAVTRGEFEVIKTLARYAIPRLLGFNEFFSS